MPSAPGVAMWTMGAVMLPWALMAVWLVPAFAVQGRR